MNLELSYYPWCWGQFSPRSSIYFMMNHVYVETNSIVKTWEGNTFEKIQWSQSGSPQLGATIEHVVFNIEWQDGRGGSLKSKYNFIVCISEQNRIPISKVGDHMPIWWSKFNDWLMGVSQIKPKNKKEEKKRKEEETSVFFNRWDCDPVLLIFFTTWLLPTAMRVLLSDLVQASKTLRASLLSFKLKQN